MGSVPSPIRVITKLPCGCKHDEQRWLQECEHHKAEHDEIHARWSRELKPQPAPEPEIWE